jgi:pyridoxal phosphate enzyme (YggS family)
MPPTAEVIAKNLFRIRGCIELTAARVRRNPAEVTIVAVTKTHAADAIRTAYEAGLRHFGENRVQEFDRKRGSLNDSDDAVWHMIGHLQRNKTARAVQLFDRVDSTDSLKQIQDFDRLVKGTRPLPILLEVRMDPTQAKTGLEKENVAAAAEAAFASPRIELRGLMCIPAYFDEPERARGYFRALRVMRDDLVRQYKRPLPVLSMGMSHDFEVAIEEGATEIRLGTALFGPREPYKEIVNP